MVLNSPHLFEVDAAWSQQKRDSHLIHFYQKYAVDGRYVFVDKSACSTIMQKQLAVDTIIQARGGASWCIEEKIERWPGYTRSNFALETDSCTVPGRERKGWMHYAQADYLLYAFEQENGDLDAYLIHFPQLRSWFWNVQERYSSHTMETLNRTRFKKVPIADVRRSVGMVRYLVTALDAQRRSA